MKQTAKHGLWMFHRHLAATKHKPFRWWIPEEFHRAVSMADAFRSGYGPLPVWPILSVGAYRVMRRYSLPMNTGTYNALVELIALRSGNDHYLTLRAAKADGRPKSPIHIGESGHVYSRFSASDVLKRAARIKEQRTILEKVKRHEQYNRWRHGPIACDHCGKVQLVGFGLNMEWLAKPVFRGRSGSIPWIDLPPINDGRESESSRMLCQGCRNKIDALERRFFAAEELRVQSNRLKQRMKQHEAAEINAGTA